MLIRVQGAVNLKQGSNAEVSTVQIVPAFPLCEHDCAHGQVAEHHPDAGGGGD